MGSLWLNGKAIIAGLRFSARRHSLTFAFWIFAIGVLAAWPFLPKDVPSQAEIQAQQAMDAAAQERRAEAADHMRYLCQLPSMCAEYGRARQECATAGSYDRCMTIKMDGAYLSLAQSECTNDGDVAAPPSNMPSALTCLSQRINDWLK